jgi:hypothetical protein
MLNQYASEGDEPAPLDAVPVAEPPKLPESPPLAIPKPIWPKPRPRNNSTGVSSIQTSTLQQQSSGNIVFSAGSLLYGFTCGAVTAQTSDAAAHPNYRASRGFALSPSYSWRIDDLPATQPFSFPSGPSEATAPAVGRTSDSYEYKINEDWDIMIEHVDWNLER